MDVCCNIAYASIVSVCCQPAQYKLTSKLARLLGIHTAKRPDIINAVWEYIRSNRLQDPTEREFINNDKYFQQVRDYLT